MGESLVDDLPGAVDLGERKEVNARHATPDAFLLNGCGCSVIDLQDRGDPRFVVARTVKRLAGGHLNQLTNRYVIPLAADGAEHPRCTVESRLELVGVTF